MSNSAKQLQSFLQDQISASEAFLRLLHEEREAVSQNLIDQLPEITDQKISQIESLTQNEINILTLLKETIGERATEAPDAAIQQLDPQGEFQLLKLLGRVRKLASECKGQNQINSQIIEGCRLQTENTLDVLLGRKKSTVYGATGKTIKHRDNSSNSLGEA